MADGAVVWESVDGPLCTVAVFDDGLSEMSAYPNLWRVVARWKGKVRLENVACLACIGSVSEWKTRPCA
jgi:hypothetical protein